MIAEKFFHDERGVSSGAAGLRKGSGAAAGQRTGWRKARAEGAGAARSNLRTGVAADQEDRERADPAPPRRREGFPDFFVFPAAAFARFSARRKFTIFRIKPAGSGLSRGNCTAPLEHS